MYVYFFLAKFPPVLFLLGTVCLLGTREYCSKNKFWVTNKTYLKDECFGNGGTLLSSIIKPESVVVFVLTKSQIFLSSLTA